MNILPTGPETASDGARLARYFDHLTQYSYDIAYNAYYAFPLEQVQSEFAPHYRRFAEEAKRRGVPSCVQIQSVVAHLADLPLTETQRHADDSYTLYEHFAGGGKNYHFASFASERWLAFLKQLTTMFRDFGFDWIVYEEPMLRTDVPGPSDPLRARWASRHPGIACPTRQQETPEYLLLQQLKRDTLVKFYDSLTRHAREAGFGQIGIMPWFFTPTFENTPIETWSSCCDTGRLTFLPATDFIVVRMQPDNITAQVMTAGEGASHPTLAYHECMAHHLGKPLIMVNNPTDEHSPEANRTDTRIPFEFFRRYTIAAAGAAPQGMSRHWYGQNLDRDTQYMELLGRVNRVLSRLGPAASDTAFVFSYAGMAHAAPRPAREAWRAWWHFAQAFQRLEGPGHQTLYAETLSESLRENPALKILVFCEWFPIPPAEIPVVKSWLDAAPGRHIVYFGGRNGTRWTADSLQHDYRLLPPEMLELWGVDTAQPVSMAYLDAGTSVVLPQETLPGGGPEFQATQEIGPAVVMVPHHAEDSPAPTIEALSDDQRVPLVWRRTTLAGGTTWLISVGLESGGADALGLSVIKHARAACGAPMFARSSPALFVSLTQTGHLVAANPSHREAQLTFPPGAQRLRYNVEENRLDDSAAMTIPPMGLYCARLVKDGTRLFDIDGAILIRAIEELPSEPVRIRGIFHKAVTVTTRDSIQGADINGQPPESVLVIEQGSGWTRTRLGFAHWANGVLAIRA